MKAIEIAKTFHAFFFFFFFLKCKRKELTVNSLLVFFPLQIVNLNPGMLQEVNY